MPRVEVAARSLEGELGEGDLLLTLGAGNVDELARRLAA
jgi:UDP-N-acetylmuramate-alanine ligase